MDDELKVESEKNVIDDFSGLPEGYLANRHNIGEKDDKPSRSLKRFKKSNIIKLIILAFLIISITIVSILIFNSETKSVTVNGFSWERKIPVEEFQIIEKSDWELPVGAVVIKEKQEIKEDALGNKIYKNGKPVYATKYYYTIERFDFAFYIESSGNDQNPYWEKTELETFQKEGPEAERIENYFIEVLNKNGESVKYSIDFESWKDLRVGDQIRIKPNDNGTATIIG